jgi:hypothetical protein
MHKTKRNSGINEWQISDSATINRNKTLQIKYLDAGRYLSVEWIYVS